MATNNLISRTDASSLIPLPVAQEIQKAMVEQSAALRLFRHVPLSAKTLSLPVISALPSATWLNGDTDLKSTTEVNWDKKTLTAEELACIVPIPEAVLQDTGYDMWAEIKPLLVEAMARALDAAVFFETNKPASWPAGVVAMAVAAGNTAVQGTASAAAGGVAQDISDVMATIEADGYDVNGFVTARIFRAVLRKLRDTTGQKLLDISPEGISFDGLPLAYAMAGLWPTAASTARLIAGDFMRGIIGIRQDISFKIFDTGVINDADGNITFNLLQQDMIAMRVVARYAYQVANPINYSQQTEASRAPFGVLLAAA